MGCQWSRKVLCMRTKEGVVLLRIKGWWAGMERRVVGVQGVLLG